MMLFMVGRICRWSLYSLQWPKSKSWKISFFVKLADMVTFTTNIKSNVKASQMYLVCKKTVFMLLIVLKKCGIHACWTESMYETFSP